MNVTIEVPQDMPAVVVALRRATPSGAPREAAGAAEYDSWTREARGAHEYDSWSRVFGQAVTAGG
jgi:hypothetical protein